MKPYVVIGMLLLIIPFCLSDNSQSMDGSVGELHLGLGGATSQAIDGSSSRTTLTFSPAGSLLSVSQDGTTLFGWMSTDQDGDTVGGSGGGSGGPKLLTLDVLVLNPKKVVVKGDKVRARIQINRSLASFRNKDSLLTYYIRDMEGNIIAREQVSLREIETGTNNFFKDVTVTKDRSVGDYDFVADVTFDGNILSDKDPFHVKSGFPYIILFIIGLGCLGFYLISTQRSKKRFKNKSRTI